MLINVNPKTAIPYGVISGHSVPHLYADIMEKGVNERLKYRDDNIRETIESLCKDLMEKADTEEIIDFVTEKANRAEEGYGGSDIESYSYTDEKGNQFRLGELGGAPIIWCIETDTIVSARKCSPCVPGAGNLDSLSENGIDCYGVPPEYLGEGS